MKKLLALTLLLCCLTSVALADTYGMGVYTTLTAAESAYVEDGDAYDGKYQAESTVCSVVLDENGVIVNVQFDMTQIKLGFTAEGAVQAEAGTMFTSKQDLKEAYGMAAYAPAGEWYVQVRALEEYCVGKTVAEVLATPATESGVLDVADLKTTCTIGVSNLLKALEMAAANAR